MPSPAPPRTFTRRRVIAGGSVLLAAPYVASRLWPDADHEDDLPGLQLAALTTDQQAAAVGYVAGSDALEDLTAVPYGGAHVVPATEGHGDGSFIGETAKVSILGLTPGATGGANLAVSRVDVDALLPHPDRSITEPLRHYAWSLRTAPFTASSPVSYIAAIGRRPRLAFTVDVTSVPGERFVSTAAFAPGAGADTISLRRGLYLLGLRPGLWSTAQDLPGAGDPTWPDLVSVVVAIDHA